jgi:hypothetical protein
MYGGTGRRVGEHYFVLGVVHIVYACFIAIGGLVLLFISKMIFPWLMQMGQMGPHNTPPPAFIGPLLHLIGWLLLIRAGAGIAAGIGLIQRLPWGRVFALIMGFISLVSIPFGTALGIYTIWVLLAAGAEQEYQRLALQPH